MMYGMNDVWYATKQKMRHGDRIGGEKGLENGSLKEDPPYDIPKRTPPQIPGEAPAKLKELGEDDNSAVRSRCSQ